LGGEKTVVLENVAIRRIDLDADRPTLVTDAGTITADRLIVTAGTWTQKLFPDWPVPLRATRQQVLYFRPADPERFAPGRLPVFIVMGAGDLDNYYGMPVFDGFGVKVAKHGGTETDPDVHDPEVGEEYQMATRDFLRSCLPALADAPVEATEVCLYNMAPDEQFQLDSPSGRADVVVASPCSGHGFKFSCLIGRVLADLVTLGSTEIPLDAWKPTPA
jgi:sarcosine oxidase